MCMFWFMHCHRHCLDFDFSRFFLKIPNITTHTDDLLAETCLLLSTTRQDCVVHYFRSSNRVTIIEYICRSLLFLKIILIQKERYYDVHQF